MSPLARHLQTSAPRATLAIRIAVGAIFLSEGTQKLLFADELGVGRFAKIGVPIPHILAPLTASFEIICGALVLVGLFTRVAAVPLLVVMVVALCSTKIPILVDRGFWKAAHEARTDVAMFLGAVFLMAAGAGPWLLDGRLSRRSPSS